MFNRLVEPLPHGRGSESGGTAITLEHEKGLNHEIHEIHEKN